MDVWGIASGGARPIAKLFLVIHVLMTLAFVVTLKRSTRTSPRAATTRFAPQRVAQDATLQVPS